MKKVFSEFTVMFENPFWIGIYERQCGKKYEVCKITFGAEPKDYEVYEFMLSNFKKLNFSPAIVTDSITDRRVNPKRIQREINHSLKQTSYMGTKAQQALKLQQEQNKIVHKSYSKKQKESEKIRQFQLHQQKRKEKHKGH